MRITYMYNGEKIDSYPSKFKTLEEAGVALNNQFAEMYNGFGCEARAGDYVYDVDSMEPDENNNIVIEMSNRRTIQELMDAMERDN